MLKPNVKFLKVLVLFGILPALVLIGCATIMNGTTDSVVLAAD